MKPKVVLIILIALVVLFVAGVGVGIAIDVDSPGASDDSPGWVDGLGNLIPPPKLRATEVVSANPPGCKNQLAAGVFEIPTSQPCVLNVGPSSAGPFSSSVRRLPLRLTPGVSARVEVIPAPAQTDRFPASDDLVGLGATSELEIFEKGGTLRIECTNGDADDKCRLVVE